MDTKSDHQEEYTIKAFIFNHWYYFKTATVDIMDVGVDYHFPYPVDLSLSHIWGGTEVAPHRPRDATLQIPINMGVFTGARGGPWFSFDINHFKNPFKKIFYSLSSYFSIEQINYELMKI